jgi:hypothetical protein
LSAFRCKVQKLDLTEIIGGELLISPG